MLQQLMWNYFSVQDCSFHGRDKSGGVARINFPTVYKNIPCNIQGLNRQDIVLQYNIKAEERAFVIFFTRSDINVDESTRIITALNPRQTITDFADEENIRIFEFKGFNERVMHRTIKLYEIYVEESERWQLQGT